MIPLASAYVFLLGLACGITLLSLTAYRHVSPAWLKWLLISLGLFVMSRYISMALFTSPEASVRFWGLRHCWFASSVGLTLPSLMAIDQLLRHPGMSPGKLLRLFSPFLVAYGSVILFGAMTPQPDRIVGWIPHLSSGWHWLLSGVQVVFVLGFLSICIGLMWKLPSPPIRRALLGLALAHTYLGLDGVWLALGKWYFRPFLYSEMVALLALWYAYETAAALR